MSHATQALQVSTNLFGKSRRLSIHDVGPRKLSEEVLLATPHHLIASQRLRAKLITWVSCRMLSGLDSEPEGATSMIGFALWQTLCF